MIQGCKLLVMMKLFWRVKYALPDLLENLLSKDFLLSENGP